jgi:hypothetical protein
MVLDEKWSVSTPPASQYDEICNIAGPINPRWVNKTKSHLYYKWLFNHGDKIMGKLSKPSIFIPKSKTNRPTIVALLQSSWFYSSVAYLL